MQGSVLIVEDDVALMESLDDTLSALAMRVGKVRTGEYALRELMTRPYEVVLLDMNMPGMGGMAACRMIRLKHPKIAIIVLTVRDGEQDKVSALEAGADDYVTKPFHLPELIARIGAALRRVRRGQSKSETILCVGAICLDTERHQVYKDKTLIHLTPTEFNLLNVLMSHAGKPVAHRTLLTSVWGPEYGDEREYLRTYVNQLRKKIEEDPTKPQYLTTENYIGYRFVEPEL
jgi:two-component system KDP operon response regulator KdpE